MTLLPRSSPMPPPGARRRRSGLSLLELVISLAVLTVVLCAAMYAVLLGGRAMQASAQPANTTAGSVEVVGTVANELRTATSFSERTDHAVTFTVPDRDGNGSAETVRYSWSGVPGEGLYRRYNAETPVLLASNVQELNFEFLLETIQPAQSVSDEGVLIQHVDGAGGWTSTFSPNYWAWGGTYFRPTLPGNVTGWRITKVALWCKRRNGSASKPIFLRLVYPNSQQKPGTTVLETLPVAAANMSSNYAWHEYSFTNQTWLTPSQGMCLIITQDVSGKSATFKYEGESSAMTPNAHYQVSWDRGSTWTNYTSYDLLFKVYGVTRTN